MTVEVPDELQRDDQRFVRIFTPLAFVCCGITLIPSYLIFKIAASCGKSIVGIIIGLVLEVTVFILTSYRPSRYGESLTLAQMLLLRWKWKRTRGVYMSFGKDDIVTDDDWDDDLDDDDLDDDWEDE